MLHRSALALGHESSVKVDFVAADSPPATLFLIHVLVAVAEHERNLISSRTKAALEAAERRTLDPKWRACQSGAQWSRMG